MGNSGWTNDQLDTITLPPSAGPGDARIVIGPDLPPPLDTYTWAGLRYTGAIIFYSQGDDTTYSYLGVVEDNAVATTDVHWGSVVSGVVVETTPGQPAALDRFANPGGLGHFVDASSALFNIAGGFTVSSALAQIITTGLTVLTPSLLRVNAPTELNGTITWQVATGGPAAVSVDATDNAGMSGTNVAYGATMTGGVAGNVLGVAFTAPPSGVVDVQWRAGQDNTLAAGVCYCALQLRDGLVVNAGAIVTAPTDPIALQLENTSQNRHGTSTIIRGLTPGGPYNITLMQRSSAIGNTAALADRWIGVIPIL